MSSFTFSTQRYESKVKSDELLLLARILELVREFPRYGYRQITRLLRNEGWRVNFKRVYRLWRKEGVESASEEAKTPATGRFEWWNYPSKSRANESGVVAGSKGQPPTDEGGIRLALR